MNSRVISMLFNWVLLIFMTMGIYSCESTKRKDLILLEEGKGLFFDQNYLSALEKFEKASKLNPKNDVASAYTGFCSLYLKDFTKALNAFNKSLSFNPHNNIALFGKGLWMYQMEDFGNAMILFDSVGNINPLHDKVFYYKALLLIKLNDTLGAQNQLNQAIANAPDYAEPYYLLASLYLAQHQKTTADSLIYLASVSRKNILSSP